MRLGDRVQTRYLVPVKRRSEPGYGTAVIEGTIFELDSGVDHSCVALFPWRAYCTDGTHFDGQMPATFKYSDLERQWFAG